MNQPQVPELKLNASFFFLILLAAGVVLGSMSFATVDTGYRGVKVRFGKVTSESLPEGLYFKIPFIEQLVTLDTRTKKLENRTSTYSEDAQVVVVTSTLNYSLGKNAAHLVYKNVGKDWESKLLLQVLEGTIKEITGKYKAVDIIGQREEVVNRIELILGEKLAERNVQFESIEINNLDFDDSFEQAVKDKVIAVEQAKEAKNKTVRITEESNQKIIQAKAEAESMSIRTQALRQSKSLVEYEAVQKWDGKLPQYMMGDSVPFLNLKTR